LTLSLSPFVFSASIERPFGLKTICWKSSGVPSTCWISWL